MTRPLTHLALGLLLLLGVQTVLVPQAQAERRSSRWREDHYGSRYNYRAERFHPLPRTGRPLRHRPRLQRSY